MPRRQLRRRGGVWQSMVAVGAQSRPWLKHDTLCFDVSLAVEADRLPETSEIEAQIAYPASDRLNRCRQREGNANATATQTALAPEASMRRPTEVPIAMSRR